MTTEALRARWLALTARLGCTGDVEAAFGLLRRHYTRPHRAYHNLDHVAACLHTLDDVWAEARDADSIETAIWFHDAVYTPGSSENEVLSAALAVNTLGNLRPSRDVVTLVHCLVLATSHRTPARTTDEKLIVDIDLAILAADEAGYRDYAKAIGREAGLEPREFARRRLRFLESMLARPRIYHTALFSERHEDAARRNMCRERDALARESKL